LVGGILLELDGQRALKGEEEGKKKNKSPDYLHRRFTPVDVQGGKRVTRADLLSRKGI
jgi:hypothetical protein